VWKCAVAPCDVCPCCVGTTGSDAGAADSPVPFGRGASFVARTTSSWPLGDDRGQRAKARKQEAERATKPRTSGSMWPPHRLCELAKACCMAVKFSLPPLTASCRRDRHAGSPGPSHALGEPMRSIGGSSHVRYRLTCKEHVAFRRLRFMTQGGLRCEKLFG
jgi:hypothetical protein